MENLADEHLKVARVLLNLSHSYLWSTSSEKSEEEGGAEKNGRKKGKKGKKKLPVEEFEKNNLEEVQEAQVKFVKNIQHVEEELPEKNVENEVQKSFDEKMEVKLGREIYNTLNKEEQQKANQEINTFCKNAHTALNGTEHEDHQNVQEEFDRGKHQSIELVEKTKSDKTNSVDLEFQQNLVIGMQEKLNENQLSKEDNIHNMEVKLNTGLQPNAEILQEFDEKTQDEFYEQQTSQGDVEIKLDIEVQGNSDLYQELNGQNQEKFDIENQQIPEGNIEIELTIEFQGNSESQQELDGKLLEKNGGQEIQNLEGDVQSEFIKNNMRQVIETNSNVNVEYGDDKQEFTTEVQKKVDNEINVDLKFNKKVQELLGEKEQNIDKNKIISFNKEHNEQILEELYREKQKVECQFDKKIQTSSEITQDLLHKVKKECGEKQPMIDGNLEQEFEEEFIKKYNAKLFRDSNKEKPIVKQIVDKNKVQFDKKDFNEDCDDEIRLKLELEKQKQNFDDIIERFYKETQQKIEKLMRDVLCGEQNVGDKTQQLLNEKEIGELKKQIQQEIKDLQRVVDKFDQEQDEILEREIVKEINEMYSLSVQENFLENLKTLLHQESAPYYERVEKLCNMYFPNMCEFRQKCDVKKQTELEKEIQQNVNKEALPKINKINVHDVCKKVQNVNGDIPQFHNKNIINNEDLVQIAEKEALLEMCGEIIEVDGKMQVNFEKKINIVTKKDVHGEIQVIKGNKQYKSEDELYKNFDVVIQLNREIQQNTDEKRRVQVHFNKQLLQMLNDNIQQNTEQNKQSDIQSKVCEDIQIIFKDAYQNMNSSIEKKVNNENDQKLNSKIEQNIEDVNTEFFDVQHFDKNIQEEDNINIQVEFFKIVKQGVERECKEKYNNFAQFEKDVDNLKSKNFFKNNSNEILQEFGQGIENKLQEKSEKDVRIEPEFDHEDHLKGDDEVVKGGESQKERDEELLVESEFEGEIQETERETQEESDVDIEGFEEDQDLKDFEVLVQNESDVCMKNLEGVFKKTYDQQLEQENDEELLLKNEKILQEIHYETNQFKEINEVVEVVDEFELETTDSVDSFSTGEEISPLEELCPIGESTNTEKEYTLENEFSSTEKKSSSLEEDLRSIDDFIREIQQKCHKDQIKNNENVPKFEKESNKDAMKVKYMYEDEIQDETDREIEKEVQQKFKDKSQEDVENPLPELKKTNLLDDLQMEIENINNLDEIPLELKIQQEQFEEELHQQFKGFQKEFYKNCKQEHDKEQRLKINNTINPVISQEFDEQQQTFYELNDEFLEIKEEYRSLVQQKIFEELQREMDEKRLEEIKEFPEQFDDELNLIDEDIHKEFVELQRDCHELEPEFKYNVPLEFEEDNLHQLLKQRPYNLFEKLYLIHKIKLCEFANSDQWPNNCLYPSSLLDALFEDPSEVIKPNVLVITLFPIDIGYSIKITMNKNDPPVETFFNYAEDSILEYVEKEQLPPHLLDLFEKAKPSLFYSGCIIAEIHDQRDDDVSGNVYRILLRPSNVSIQSDMNQIIAENSHINWTSMKRLKLESMLLKVNYPVMCMDSSPIAGLTVQLQHQMLSPRTIQLNPLKNKHTSSELHPLGTDLLTSSYDTSFTKNLSNESQKESSKLINTEDDEMAHQILWKFDFRLQSFNLIKLYVLVVRETLKYSMLLNLNSKVECVKKIRFKINLETFNLKNYIDGILKILKQKINPDILVVRKYKCDDKSEYRTMPSVPTLFSDNIYEPNPTDISQLVDTLLENELEVEKHSSSFTPLQLSSDNQKAKKIKKNSRGISETNEDIFQEVQNAMSSNIDNYRGVKRRRTTS